MKKELLKELPQVLKLVERYRDKYPEVYIKSAARKVLESFRKEILEGRRTHILDLYEILEEQIIKECLTSLRRNRD
ncbi:hypothetical protein [Thermocrinis minervae]|uniref:Uncharacterized protein n=1 Tax=Thermocrinis minervae TaxID=381751 RepID=A0A1M6SZD4_9AQUI|nr:hypothetical protein [Thermocrinis minervae]SHK50017.1 hypothetical protein SAMN05444391_1229 [Thermocrinis minervae]